MELFIGDDEYKYRELKELSIGDLFYKDAESVDNPSKLFMLTDIVSESGCLGSVSLFDGVMYYADKTKNVIKVKSSTINSNYLVEIDELKVGETFVKYGDPTQRIYMTSTEYNLAKPEPLTALYTCVEIPYGNTITIEAGTSVIKIPLSMNVGHPEIVAKTDTLFN